MEPLDIVKDVAQQITRGLEGAVVTIDAPAATDGHWWLDVAYDGRTATVEWRPKQGFGVGMGEDAYGEGPNIIFPSASDAAHYIIGTLASGAIESDVVNGSPASSKYGTRA
jgi:hypothetical protein